MKGYAPTSTVAVVSVEHIPKPRRIRRAVTGFGLWFLGAMVSVLVPVGHFLLVPTCLITAFVVASRRLGMADVVVRCHGSCPDCGAEQDMDVPGTFKLPKDVTCRSCQRPLVLTEEVTAAAA